MHYNVNLQAVNIVNIQSGTNSLCALWTKYSAGNTIIFAELYFCFFRDLAFIDIHCRYRARIFAR